MWTPQALALSSQTGLSRGRAVQAQGDMVASQLHPLPRAGAPPPPKQFSPQFSTKAGARLAASGVLSSEKPTSPFIASRPAEVSRHGEGVCRDFKAQGEEKRLALIKLNQHQPRPGFPSTGRQPRAKHGASPGGLTILLKPRRGRGAKANYPTPTLLCSLNQIAGWREK